MNPQPNKKLYKVCLTGGPCSGKTTALTTLMEKFSTEFIVYCIPELATMTFSSGVTIIPELFTPETHKTFIQGMCQAQMDLEKYYEAIASIQQKPVVLIVDRGTVDNFAYCSAEVKEKILESSGWNMNYLRNERYDLVIHLVTAAFGAEEFYTLENNTARSESKEQAIMVDNNLRREWLGHPHYNIIDNSAKGFAAKIDRVVRAVSSLVKVPVNQFVNKFLLKKNYTLDELPKDVKFETFRDEITYLVNNDKESLHWIVKRTYKGSPFPIYISVNRRLSEKPSDRIETRKMLTEKVYYDYISQRDPKTSTITKDIIAFYYERAHHILFYYIENVEVNDRKLCILRVFKDIENEHEVFVPEFLEAEKDVTNNQEYHSYVLAKKA